MVMATQNPLEQAGTYPLPEAQLDRFLLHVSLDYPSGAEELEILRRDRAQPAVAHAPLTAVIDTATVLAARAHRPRPPENLPRGTSAAGASGDRPRRHHALRHAPPGRP